MKKAKEDIYDADMQRAIGSWQAAAARVLRRKVYKKDVTMVTLSGMTDLARNTVQNALDTAATKSGSSPRAETFVRIAHALGLSPSEFARSVAHEIDGTSENGTDMSDPDVFTVPDGDSLLICKVISKKERD